MREEDEVSFQRRAEAFRSLHQSQGIFVIPNPWDAGSARILQTHGFKALATTSAGLAFSLGRPDGMAAVSRYETLLNVKSIVDATDLPVSADLENGFGHDPKIVAETITLASLAGLAGGSIEDATGNNNDPIYAFELSVERIKAAVETVRGLSRPFTLTARAENLIHGKIDLKDTVKRLEAYAAAGADVLFAPGLKTLTEIETVVKAVAPKPVNIVMGLSGGNFSVKMLEDVGVKRVSLGSSLIRASYTGFYKAFQEISKQGTFGFANDAVAHAELNKLFNGYESK
ncbi:MAG: oxaloacetate decarboxylase [Chryseolinea sp.]